MKTSLKFFINRDKASSRGGSCPLYLRVIHNSKKSEGRLNLRNIEKKDLKSWHDLTERFDKNFEFNHNRTIEIITSEFDDYIRLNRDNLHNLAASEIRDYLLKRNLEKSKLVYECALLFYQKNIVKNTNIADGTKRNYKKSVNHFTNFLVSYGYDKLLLVNFKRKHAMEFIDYLLTTNSNSTFTSRPMTGVSAQSIVKNIKPMFRNWYLSEEIGRDPFKDVRIKFDITIKPRLMDNHFISLYQLQFLKEDKMEYYRDLFLMLCYTGLGYADFFAIKRRDLLYIKGEVHIDTSRIKTNTIIRQTFPKQVIELLDKYKGNDEVKLKDTLLPKRSLKEINANLKVLAFKVGVSFPLTSYVARRYYRQQLAEAGIQESLLVKTMMGHKFGNDIDKHYLVVSDKMLVKAKQILEAHFINLIPSK